MSDLKGYTLSENVSLTNRTTFRVMARTALFAEIHATSALPELLTLPQIKPLPCLVLGAGSNLLFTRDWPGLIITIATRGIQILEDDGETARVRVAAGENWHDLVSWTLHMGLRGLENLSLIPGSVGAAPIQNIGAYGAELAENLFAVEAFDRTQNVIVRLTASECNFAYRWSVFKSEPQRWIICAVEFQLRRSTPFKLDYPGIREELANAKIDSLTASAISQAICRLRLRKLPNPAVIGNAGSFFKNPIVALDTAIRLRQDHPSLPIYPTASGQAKLSAAWLIEQCAWKGFREGDAGVSAQHALVLVNYGQASGASIWSLAQRIIESVEQRFGVTLEAEPVVV